MYMNKKKLLYRDKQYNKNKIYKKFAVCAQNINKQDEALSSEM